MKKLLTGLRTYGRSIYSCVGMFLFPIVTFYLFDGYTHNPFTTMKPVPQLLNIIFFELTMLFFFGLFGHIRTALMVQTGFFMLAGLANYFVLSFRSAPIMPWDIYSIRTAASVAGGFSYKLEAPQILILLGFLLLLVLEFFCSLSLKGCKLYRRLSLIAVPFVLLWGFTSMLHQETYIRKFHLYDKLFTPAVMSKRCGNSVAFLMELKYISVDKPEGYKASEAKELLLSYTSDTDTDASNRPNIIVVMNEAFSDLSVLGDFETNADYMPFLHSLQKDAPNTVTGWLNASVLGGNTANTEFEFLTGHTMAFLPQGSVAYQQYVKNATPALPSHLKELGYKTVAMHPYHATGWERDRVYPLLGFDEMYFLDDYDNIRYLRKYTDDYTCYDKIIEAYENKGDDPLFIFNVTMQNHSPYTEEFENFTPDITVEGIDSDTLDNYLSLIRRSDEALEYLIGYFKEADEDTIIVFFGDHQPTMSVSKPIRKLNGSAVDNLNDEENSLYYKVPFVVWANFDIEEQADLEISPGILSANVLNYCNLPLTPYENFLRSLSETYPAISSQAVIGTDNSLSTISEIRKDDTDYSGRALLNDYQTLQYYLLFDWKETANQ
ncbi:MAG: LTA synthase family protein [Clostridiales bacterium]|nr:LTA synthase family protein [Clostridiales bacterium]